MMFVQPYSIFNKQLLSHDQATSISVSYLRISLSSNM